jgi:hypothetical protein
MFCLGMLAGMGVSNMLHRMDTGKPLPPPQNGHRPTLMDPRD